MDRKIEIMEHESMGYAVFVKINGSSFWQQVSKWYLYRKCAENALRRYKNYVNQKM